MRTLRRFRDAESGETLVELVVTIVIIGVAVVALMSGLATGVIASDVHRNKATGDTIARNSAEALKDRNLAWQSTGVYTVPGASGYSVAVTARCWDGNTPATFGPCPNSDRGLQELTVTVTKTAGRTSTDVVTVLKRRP